MYDAAGNKLKKIVKETNKPDKTTLYLFGTYQDEVLQLLPQEEGRIRKKDDGTFTYDYFLKDHLGNVRMVLTEEQKTDAYPPASLETATINTEKSVYSIPDDPATRVKKTDVMNYPGNDNYTTPNDYIHKLRGDATKVGSAILLKVMAGDKVNIHASSWWKSNGSTPNPSNTTSAVTELANALLNSLPGMSGGKVAAGSVSSGTFSPAISSLLTARNTTSYQGTKPKAYLNWILLDEQFKEVPTTDGQNNSGFEQVGDDGEFKPHNKAGVEMTKSGYLYVYVSNESTDINVYFDNLQVAQVRGPVLEETHYYPFGLTMAGISSQAAGSLENKRKFNKGSELQNKEFSDGSGLQLYATNFRSLDPQLGRWWQIDPKPDMVLSPYSAMGNNPISLNDPFGDTAVTRWRTGFLGLGGKHEARYVGGQWIDAKTRSAINANDVSKARTRDMMNDYSGLNKNKDFDKVTDKINTSSANVVFNSARKSITDPGNAFRNGTSNELVVNLAKSVTLGAVLNEKFTPVTLSGQQVMGHELGHVLDILNKKPSDFFITTTQRGPFSTDMTISNSEINAMYWENILRSQAGLPLRKYYADAEGGIGGTVLLNNSAKIERDKNGNPVSVSNLDGDKYNVQ